MKTQQLIDLLAADGAARREPSLRLALGLAVAAGAALAAVALLVLLHVRVDLGRALQQPRFAFKLALVVATAIVGCGLLARLARPEAQPGRWRWLLALLPLALAVACLTEMAVLPAAEWRGRMMGYSAGACLIFVPLMAAGPLALLLLALRRSAPRSPALTGAVAGLAATGIGASFYAMHCADDSPLFVLAWYGIAAALLSAIGAIVGARLLRW